MKIFLSLAVIINIFAIVVLSTGIFKIFEKPKSKWISNKTCAVIENPDEIKEALIYQLTHGVRWRESVQEMVNLGIDNAIEIGPGNVLSGLISRTTDKIITKKLED